MSKVIWHVTMSLDGFIAGPDDSMNWALNLWQLDETNLGEDRQRLVDDGFGSAMADEIVATTGAILAGRRWYDIAMTRFNGVEGIYGGAWTGPVVVLTHRPPTGPHHPAITFVSDDVPKAIATALDAAGGNNVVVFGASIAQQCLRAGLLDEIAIHLAPVLLGEGIRFFEAHGSEPIKLEPTSVTPSGQVTDLRFRVPR
jgi:dihydrofolate reductase